MSSEEDAAIELFRRLQESIWHLQAAAERLDEASELTAHVTPPGRSDQLRQFAADVEASMRERGLQPIHKSGSYE